MNVLIISTKSCRHRSILEKQLQLAEIPYTAKFAEDNSELVEKHNMQTALIVVVEGKVVFRHSCEKPFPSQAELLKFIEI